MELIYNKIFETFCVEYIFCVILATYLFLKVVDYFNGDDCVPTWLKRVTTFLVGSIMLLLFKIFSDVAFESLMASYFAAIFVYDTAIKYILKKLDIDYKK